MDGLAIFFVFFFILAFFVLLYALTDDRTPPTEERPAPAKNDPSSSPDKSCSTSRPLRNTEFSTKRPDFEKYLRDRGVKYLVHFTDARNLESIFEHGIVPRAFHERSGIKAFYSDPNRFDHHRDASSFTFSFPNYKMFYSVVQRSHPGVDYAVLFVDAKVACNFDTAFFTSNAASFWGTSLASHKSFGALALMFSEDGSSHYSRSELHIPDNYSTDPQAEVMVFDTVPCECIKGVCFRSQRALDRYSKFVPASVHSGVNSIYFDARRDSRCWYSDKYVESPPLIKPVSSVLFDAMPAVPFDVKKFNAQVDKNISLLNASCDRNCSVCMSYISGECFGGGLCPDYRYSGRQLRQ